MKNWYLYLTFGIITVIVLAVCWIPLMLLFAYVYGVATGGPK